MCLYNVVVFVQSGFSSGKSGCIRVKLLYSGKVVVFGQKWLYSGKSGCIREKRVVFGKKW